MIKRIDENCDESYDNCDFDEVIMGEHRSNLSTSYSFSPKNNKDKMKSSLVVTRP